jgi:signal transduction histidine kinase/ligand-binding sensor domain-containing protein/DNA-binding NarL/FixJ family response regulator
MRLISLFKLPFFVTCFFLLLSTSSKALQPVKYLGIDQGLSNNSVTCIFKDHYGFMWFGTYNGLNRYDGEKFKVFRNIWGDPNSLCYNYIFNIAELGDKILVGTQKGLVYYNYTDSKFHPVYYQDAKTKKCFKITCNINSMAADRAGNVYIATDKLGLILYNKQHGLCKQLLLNGTINNYDAGSTTVDDNNQLWFFVKGVGLFFYNTLTGKSTVVTSQLRYASCLLRDNNNNIWIGTDGGGLFIYNLALHRLTRFNDIYGRLTSDNIASLKIVSSGNLWIGTNGGGVNIVDLKTRQLSYLVPGEEKGSLSSGAISGIYEDDGSRKWIATLRGGVNIVENKEQPFRLFTHDPFNKNTVISNFIKSFCEDETGNLWIGTDGGGLSYCNTKNNSYTTYVHSESANSLSSNFVVSILNDYKNQVWVATFNGGIDAFNKSSKTFKHYTCYNTADKKEDKTLWDLYEDHEHNLWAGCTRNGALYLYNRAKDKFELFDKSLINIHVLFEDHAGNLWGGDYNRLIKINRQGGKHRFVNIDYAVRAITEDKENNLWLGTDGGGLLLFDRTKNTYKRYTQNDGLPGNSILNLLVDNNGVIWASTYSGLASFDARLNKFKNYNASDGLQSNQFNYNAALKRKNGELLFGGINGFNMFNPDNIEIAGNQPDLRLTGLRVNNVSIEGNNPYTDHEPLVDLKSLTIPYDQATLAIDYAALEYSLPGKISYAYYLQNWDHSWNYVGKLKTAYYTRLNEGSYILRIKATNTAGAWSNKQLIINITVLPPWQRSWWAYLLYMAIISALVYGFWRYHARQTALKYEVAFANLRVDKEKELNEKKLSFFTNVSHEFRTPLTLIINPIKDLLQSEHNKDNGELNTIYRNARRLLGLVDHLLLFRKAESENDVLNLVNLNFSALCKEVYLCFTAQAKTRNINYQFEISNTEIFIVADREKIEIALFNLISNAIKFTPDNGVIKIHCYETNTNAMFTVTDSGCGIKEGVGEKLFDKFYQIKDGISLKTGFGIGLYLVKTFINVHNGSIRYAGNPQGGTTFTVELPKGDLAPALLNEPGDIDQHLIDELVSGEPNDIKPLDEEVNNLELLISERQSILIIDDNVQLRTYIKKIFKESYKIYEAGNGEDGLETIKKYLPDIVISDVVMGALSGIEMCRIIKQDSSLSHIPVILLTGGPDPEAQLKGIEVGAVAFVSKPFEKDLLIARVQGILKDRRELQNYFYQEVTLKNNTRNISEHHKDFLYKCISIIESYLTDPNFDIKTIAAEMGMSYSSLFKKIKSVSGQSVNGFVRFVRLRKAAEIMIHTNCNVNEAALNAGFNDIKYFREHFIKQFGEKPSEFIKKHRTAFNKTYLVEENIG